MGFVWFVYLHFFKVANINQKGVNVCFGIIEKYLLYYIKMFLWLFHVSANTFNV